MQIRMLVSIAGPDWSARAGEVIEPDDAEAARLVSAGFAVPMRGVETETATVAPAERAVMRRGRRQVRE